MWWSCNLNWKTMWKKFFLCSLSLWSSTTCSPLLFPSSAWIQDKVTTWQSTGWSRRQQLYKSYTKGNLLTPAQAVCLKSPSIFHRASISVDICLEPEYHCSQIVILAFTTITTNHIILITNITIIIIALCFTSPSTSPSPSSSLHCGPLHHLRTTSLPIWSSTGTGPTCQATSTVCKKSN